MARLMIMIMCLLSLFSPFQLMLAFQSVHNACHSEERSALLQFKESFITDCRYAPPFIPSAYPKVASWKLEGNGSGCCSWDGVECDVDTGHVIGLNLTASCLYGSLDSNSSLFRLLHLQKLSLALNDFNGSRIPSALGNLSELRYLTLSNSLFSGQIPSEISSLSKLSGLDLSFESFERLLQLKTPDLKALVQNLSSLEYLFLDSVDISSPVPAILANFTSLRGLSLAYCGLHGKFPTAIFQLPYLQALRLFLNPALQGHLPGFPWGEQLAYLRLSNTSFSGQLPASIGNLSSLEFIDIAVSNFSGFIPSSIGNLSKLTFLSFPSNKLQGSIPASISGLKRLQYLNLYSNNLVGTVDLSALLMLQNLSVLHLSSNNLSMVVSKSRTNSTLPKLVSLGLASCNLSVFPDVLSKQDYITWLDLSFNILTGKIPKWIWTMSTETLEYMDLSHNFLTGFEEPPVVLPWSRLRVLNLSSNILQGSLPVPPSSTVLYSISNNSLAGEIPPLMCNVSRLQVLDLSNNNLSGIIPQCLGNFSNSLSILNLQGNNFYGTIPPTWTNGSGIRMINLGENKLGGRIPRSIASCVKLESLNLGNNQLNDSFPHWLGTLPLLKILILRSNRLHGEIGTPGSDSKFSKLHIIDLSSNYFTGSLPIEYFRSWNAMQIAVVQDHLTYIQAYQTFEMNCQLLPDPYDSSRCFFENGFSWFADQYDYSMSMTTKGTKLFYEKITEMFTAIDLSCNKFEGEIPKFIGNLRGLCSLNLSNNILSGLIPPSIKNLEKLETLDLSQNRLSGKIPQQFAHLTFLEVFNVSHNHLEGPIPLGNQFNTFPYSSFDGNPGLCGEPLSTKCQDPEALPAAPPPIPDESFGLDWKFVLMGYASGIVFGVVYGHIVTKRKRDWFMKFFRVRQPRRQRRTRRRHGN